ncbi:MAG: hypothetical protein ABJH04_08205 [Cyclobacteriaceae bacterium]
METNTYSSSPSIDINAVYKQAKAYANGLARNSDLASDIVQDFFTNVYSNPEKYLAGLTCNRMIYVGLRNELSNRLRQEYKYANEPIGDFKDISSHSFVGRLDVEKLKAFFLPSFQDDVVRLDLKEGRSIEQISRLRGVSKKYVGKIRNSKTTRSDSKTNQYLKMLMDGYTALEIAEVTGHDKGTVLSTVTYLRRKMKAKLEASPEMVAFC